MRKKWQILWRWSIKTFKGHNFTYIIIGGRDYIIPWKVLYTRYISGIYCQLGDYMLPTFLFSSYLVHIEFIFPIFNFALLLHLGEKKTHNYETLRHQSSASILAISFLYLLSFCITTSWGQLDPLVASPFLMNNLCWSVGNFYVWLWILVIIYITPRKHLGTWTYPWKRYVPWKEPSILGFHTSECWFPGVYIVCIISRRNEFFGFALTTNFQLGNFQCETTGGGPVKNQLSTWWP